MTELALVGDPWRDRGTVRLESALATRGVHTDRRSVGVSIDVGEELAREVALELLREGWNEIFTVNHNLRPLVTERGLQLHRSLDPKGFLVTDGRIELSQSDQSFLKEKHHVTIRKSAQPIWVPRPNFIGTKKDIERIRGKAERYVRAFAEALYSSGEEVCPVCSRESDSLQPVHQYENPFYNKHHTNPPRGFRSTNVYAEACGVCLFLGLLTTLDPWVPYSESDDETTLLVPNCSNYGVLVKVWSNLRRACFGQNEPNSSLRRTNLPNRFARDPYSLIVTAYANIFNRAAVKRERDLFLELGPEEARELHEWFLIPVARGQNVNIGAAHRIAPPVSLAHHVRDIQADGVPFNILSHVLLRIRLSDHEAVIVEGLSRTLVENRVDRLVRTSFEWSRVDSTRIIPLPGLGSPIHLLRDVYIPDLLEEWKMLDPTLRDDLRALGAAFGNAFASDVGMLSKLYNATSQQRTTEALADALFRMYKMAAGGEARLYPIKPDRFARLQGALATPEWKDAWSTFLTFTFLSAINRNAKDGGGEA